MDDNAIHEWLIKCFGPIQGEMAWQQISQLPEEIRAQLMSQDPQPTAQIHPEVQQMMAAFSAGGLNTMGDMQRTVEEGPINVKLAKSIALQQANASGSAAQRVRRGRRGRSPRDERGEPVAGHRLRVRSRAPASPDVLTRAGWVEGTDRPVGQVRRSRGRVDERRFGLGDFRAPRRRASATARVAGMFAGPVPIPIPDGMKDPGPTHEAAGQHVLCHAAGACGRQSEP